MKCKISRDKRGVDKGIYPTYYLHLDREDGKRQFLLAARRRKKSTTSNYLISCDATDLKRDGDSFIGKLRSNFLGTNFVVFDNGMNPDCKLEEPSKGMRRELSAIAYVRLLIYL